MTDLATWAQSMLDRLSEHMDAEREVLQAYSSLAEQAPGHLKFLIGMITTDEIRHHQLFEQLSEGLKAEIGYPTSEQKMPQEEPISDSPELRRELRNLTERLLAIERQDDRELERLQRELRKVADTRWWGALVETMRFDTAKHIALLDYIERSL